MYHNCCPVSKLPLVSMAWHILKLQMEELWVWSVAANT
jgi:hypothetical protein